MIVHHERPLARPLEQRLIGEDEVAQEVVLVVDADRGEIFADARVGELPSEQSKIRVVGCHAAVDDPPSRAVASFMPCSHAAQALRARSGTPCRKVRGGAFLFRSRTPVHRSPQRMAIPARALDEIESEQHRGR